MDNTSNKNKIVLLEIDGDIINKVKTTTWNVVIGGERSELNGPALDFLKWLNCYEKSDNSVYIKYNEYSLLTIYDMDFDQINKKINAIYADGRVIGLGDLCTLTIASCAPKIHSLEIIGEIRTMYENKENEIRVVKKELPGETCYEIELTTNHNRS